MSGTTILTNTNFFPAEAFELEDEICEYELTGFHYLPHVEARELLCCDWLNNELFYCDDEDGPENDHDNTDLNVSDDHEDEFMDVLCSLEPVLSAKAIENLLNNFYDKKSEGMLDESTARQQMDLDEQVDPEVIEVRKMRRANKRYNIDGVDTRRTRAGRRIGNSHYNSIYLPTRQEKLTHIIIGDQVFRIS